MNTDNLIGPLTAEEWCAFRVRDNDDLLQCCGVTSDMRDAIFRMLCNGADRDDPFVVLMFKRAWPAMKDHGLPDGRGGELLRQLADYYLSERVST